LALAEAIAEAVYLLECPSALTSDLKTIQGQVMACLVSEPCRRSVPWPYAADCHITPGQASHAELCQVSLKPHPGPKLALSPNLVQSASAQMMTYILKSLEAQVWCERYW
jgi:hypothetical protein